MQEISPKSLQNNIYYVGACVLIFLVSLPLANTKCDPLTQLQYAEFANLATHLHLASLRSKGSKKRHLPNGFGFKTCTYANYSFELLAWTAFTALTLEWAAAGFLLISFLQIALWAQKKYVLVASV